METTASKFLGVKMRVKEVYERLGISEKFFKENSKTSPDDFIKILGEIENRIPEMNCRVVPSSFNPDDENLRAFPYTLSPSWNSCETALRAFGARGVMMRLPLFWQTESLLHSACRAVGAFIFLNETANMPVGALAIRVAEVATVVTDINDAYLFSSYLAENKFPMGKTWIIVHPIKEGVRAIPEALMEKGIHVAQEVHVFPGVPVLDQCANLWADKSTRFHVSDSYIHENAGGGLLITSAENEPMPFFRYHLSIPLRESGKCVCGKIIFETKT